MREFLHTHHSTSSFLPYPSLPPAVQMVASAGGNGRVLHVGEQQQLGPLADAMALTALREANASHSALGSAINGIAYVYTTPCYDEDEDEDNDKALFIDQQNTNQGSSTEDSGGSRPLLPLWRLNALSESDHDGKHLLLRPSSSYMGRILEGEYFFGPRGATADERSISVCPAAASAASSSDSPLPAPVLAPCTSCTCSASTCRSRAPRLGEEDQLLALYIHYLRSIEISHITSPRALLRAAGKV